MNAAPYVQRLSTLMIDLDAPIVPGQSAGGIVLGSHLDKLVRETGDYFTLNQWPRPSRPLPEWYMRVFPPPPITTVYTSAAIDLWVRDGAIDQIGVHDGYRGKVANTV